ncbi:Putative protein of unknown function [Podospora comata]|uniref:Uncharacterized protein n=1 Tax=Podospora comata TaxID=48703 RepID=A0ABY6S1P5_PODCO|nr:Putative protein of unknown function [Podospora comata]
MALATSPFTSPFAASAGAFLVALASHLAARVYPREGHRRQAEERGVPAPDVLLVALASHALADVAAGNRHRIARSCHRTAGIPSPVLSGHLPDPLTLCSLAAHDSEGPGRFVRRRGERLVGWLNCRELVSNCTPVDCHLEGDLTLVLRAN